VTLQAIEIYRHAFLSTPGYLFGLKVNVPVLRTTDFCGILLA